MNEFNAIKEELFLSPRILTRAEYRIIKTHPDWYNQKKFWIMHLTKSGFEMYNQAESSGQQGKWLKYCEIWEIVNSPLFKALNEV